MNQLKNEFRIAVNDIMVSYTDDGKSGAPSLIFIHGFPFNKSMWNHQVEVLKNKYHVITYDIRGHGNSDNGNENFSIELFAKDLISLMDLLKIDKTMLCGLSMGGYISLNAISNFPERFDALVLSDTQCIADTTEAKEKRMNAIKNIRDAGVEKYADESIKNLFSPESFITRKNAISDVREMIIKTSEQSLCNTLLALAMRKETCSKLQEIKVPVLIMVGKEDIVTPPAAALLMHEKIKNSSLHIIEHAGHLSNMENPDEFNKQLKKFVSSVY
jgi:Predicted hydrolases or acyltransferases (alpha/beta hydrolase superfamily)